MDYPIQSFRAEWNGHTFPALMPAIEFYSQRRYEVALKLFRSRPPDPARGMRKFICTFYGPIGWLLMANTRIAKNTFLRLCEARCLYRLGRFEEALNTIENDSGDDHEYLKAWCQYSLGNYKEAKKTFGRVFLVIRRFKTGHASALENRPPCGGYWVEESS